MNINKRFKYVKDNIYDEIQIFTYTVLIEYFFSLTLNRTFFLISGQSGLKNIYLVNAFYRLP